MGLFTKKFRKLLTVYASVKHDRIIYTPNLYDGIYVEMKDPITSAYNIEDAEIGKLVKQEFARSEWGKTEMPSKKSEWPAFQISEMKTISSFEQEYRRIAIMGANDANIIFEITVDLRRPDKIELFAAKSAVADDKEIGSLIKKLASYDIEHEDHTTS